MDALTQARRRESTWIHHWDPEDREQWEGGGRSVARRNLWVSIFCEHLGFSVWSIWSVLVLFMVPAQGFSVTPDQKFLLVSVVTLVGATLRIPYTLAVPRFGGRNWTVFSAFILLLPAVAAAVLMQRPDSPLWMFLLVGALAGVGGGNFASSMANISAFYPEREKGWALGLNAGGGNLGVAAVQVVGLLVIAAATTAHPEYVSLVYLPLIVVAGLLALWRMDNLAGLRADVASQLAVLKDRNSWIMSFLYIGTFGSFIGYGFAFGLVLQNEFGRTPLQAASLTFIGPLVGSVSRPLGGRLADRLGGARVTLWTFAGMAAGTGLVLAASAQDSLALFIAAFITVFALSGIGNGSTYKMIPAIFAAQAASAIDAGGAPEAARARARRLSAALIGIAGAVGALGGVLINLAFREAYRSAGAATPAFLAFLFFYLVCIAVTYVAYLRRPAPHLEPAYSSV